MSDPSLDALIAGIWAQMGPEQHATARRLAEALSEVHRGADPAVWGEVRELSHRLAGSLGSLGQHAAGHEAVVMEELTAGVERPDPDLVLRLTVHANALLEHLAVPSSGERPTAD